MTTMRDVAGKGRGPSRRWVLRSTSAVAAGLAAPAIRPAWVQAHPTRPITLIVPFTPEGPTDILARLLGQRLGAERC